MTRGPSDYRKIQDAAPPTSMTRAQYLEAVERNGHPVSWYPTTGQPRRRRRSV